MFHCLTTFEATRIFRRFGNSQAKSGTKELLPKHPVVRSTDSLGARLNTCGSPRAAARCGQCAPGGIELPLRSKAGAYWA